MGAGRGGAVVVVVVVVVGFSGGLVGWGGWGWGWGGGGGGCKQLYTRRTSTRAHKHEHEHLCWLAFSPAVLRAARGLRRRRRHRSGATQAVAQCNGSQRYKAQCSHILWRCVFEMLLRERGLRARGAGGAPRLVCVCGGGVPGQEQGGGAMRAARPGDALRGRAAASKRDGRLIAWSSWLLLLLSSSSISSHSRSILAPQGVGGAWCRVGTRARV